MWDLGVILLSLGLLMYTAYRGFSVILMAPICALLAVLLINPANVLPFYSGVFMPKMVGFIKDYFLVFYSVPFSVKWLKCQGLQNPLPKPL